LKSIPFLGAGAACRHFVLSRQGAPEHPALAGAAAGLLAGAIGAALYATHCPDDSPLFVAVWYTLAITFITALALLQGRGFCACEEISPAGLALTLLRLADGFSRNSLRKILPTFDFGNPREFDEFGHFVARELGSAEIAHHPCIEGRIATNDKALTASPVAASGTPITAHSFTLEASQALLRPHWETP